MQLYLRLRDVPELSDLAPRDRLRVWFACVRHSPRSVRTWTAFLVVFVPFALPLLLPTWWMFFIVAPVLFVPLILNFNRLQVEELRPFFQEYRARVGLTKCCS